MLRAECGPLAGRRRRTSLGSWEGLPASAHIPEESADLNQALRRRVLAYGLKHCLTPSQQEAIELCCLQGLTGTEAARRLGVHPSTVNRRLRRALDRLRGLTRP